ncbi:MAG: hypothetical protein D6761_07580, partial [Candidatus Dadabacteria bacterium]
MHTPHASRPWSLAGTLFLMAAVAVTTWLAVRPAAPPAPDSVHVRRGGIVEAVFGIGTVRSDHEFTLRSGIQTRVQTLHVR